MANRLQFETSPYLLQHANNPVDWYPWGAEAFEMAARLNRPIFLSIGYSTCHWCHVMEQESFEDLEIAQYLNEHYISIKVDREERPDIDAIYMSAVQTTTGRGGWPMSVWLTDEKLPFYAGTYFPPRAGSRGSSFGFLEVLKHLQQKFVDSPAEVAHFAAEITQAVREALEGANGSNQVSEQSLQNALHYYETRFDTHFGGLIGQPKFPSSYPIRTLLRLQEAHPNPQLLENIKATLRAMARGGIYDHVAGGFHRYSTDAEWLVPHFEKMLYDNALLARAYTEAYQATGEPEFAAVTHDIFAYLHKDMTSPDGVFYSATDADSVGPTGEMDEGYFFTWTLDELQQLLSPEELRFCQSHYNLTHEGNFEGRNILFVDRSLPWSTNPLLQRVKANLYASRSKRPHPLRDEKILVSWNALMISALAKAATVFDRPEYLQRATRAASFISNQMFIEGQLYRVHKDSKAKQLAFLDDHAFLLAAFLDLYEASSDVQWLRDAINLEKSLHADFEDTHHGGYFMTSQKHETLIAREKPAYDGAEPSGNSVHALNLLRLHQFTMQNIYRERGDRCLAVFSAALERSPMSLSEMLVAHNYSRAMHQEIIVVTASNEKRLSEPFVDMLRKRYLPNSYTLVLTQEEAQAQAYLVPALQGKIAIEGKVTAYVCEEGACQLPVTDASKL